MLGDHAVRIEPVERHVAGTVDVHLAVLRRRADVDERERLAAAVRAWVGAHWHDDADARLHERLIQFVESQLLDEALARTGDNRSAAARMLGLDRATLRSKLDR
jgi:DNA-binding protein Fis